MRAILKRADLSAVPRIGGALQAVDRILGLFLAGLLLLAALGKASSGSDLLHGWVPWELAAAIESGAAYLLVFWPRHGWVRAGVGMFFFFLAGFSLAAILRGSPTCDCLGAVPATPKWLFGIDLLGGGWLLASGLHGIQSKLAPPPQITWTVTAGRAGFFAAALALGASAMGSSYWLGMRPQLGHPLQVNVGALDLGDMWLSEEIEHRLVITNTSNRELSIARFDATCACTRIEPQTLNLEPSESKSVTLRIDLFKIAREDWKARQWPLSIDLHAVPTADSACRAVSWRLTGRVNSPFRTVPEPSVPSLTLARLAPPSEVTFNLHLAPGLRLRQIEPTQKGISCALRDEDTLTPRVAMRIDPRQTEAGTFLAKARLCLEDDSRTELPPLPLGVPVTVRPAVSLEPSLLLLLDGTPSSAQLRSASGTRFSIVRITALPEVNLVVGPMPESEFSLEHTVAVRAASANPSLSLDDVTIDVQLEAADFVERLRLRVQRPTQL